MAKILGYTRTGKPVPDPGRGAPNTNDVTVFRRVKGQHAGWTKADHMDAAKLLEALAATSPDPKKRRFAIGWASTHWDVGGRWTTSEFEAGTR